MRLPGGRTQLFGAVSVVAAIVVGAALPVVLNVAAPASSLALSRAPVAACSPPAFSSSAAPVAAASPPCELTLTAQPHSGLRDGQTITVDGSGFAPDAFVPLVECLSGAGDASQCDLDFGGFAEAGPTGSLSAQVTVTRLVETGTTTSDCAVRRACVLAALDEDDNTVAVATPITFKNVPLPTLSVSPASGLTDGQDVTVSGARFGAGQQVVFTECPLGESEFFNCDFDAVTQATAGAAGTFTAGFDVARLISTNNGTVDCAQAPGCVLAALGNLNDEIIATASLSFNPRVPPLPPLDVTLALKATGQVDTSGGAALSGTVSCSAKQPVPVDLEVELTEQSDLEAADSSVTTTTTCAKAPGLVAVTLPDQDVPFSAGLGQVTVSLSARDGSSVTQQTFDGAVTLTVPAHQPPPVYYVALGDSLAAGYASPPGQGYVNDLLADVETTVPDVQLVDLGCSGETTTSMIEGDSCYYPAGSQLAAATAFLASHQGSVVLVTIDNGGNDYLGCLDAYPPSYNAACISATNGTVTTNLRTIMTEIRAAAGASVPIGGMNYFDPFLDYWPEGADGVAVAKESVPVVGVVNATIDAVYASASAPVADVSAAFATTDLSHRVASPWGRVPVAVDNTCRWLDFTCARGVGGFGDDTDAAGSAVIAGAFEKVLPAGLTSAASRPPG